MNPLIVLVALVGYATSAVVPQVYVKSGLTDVVGGQVGVPVQSSLYQLPNVNSVVSPLLNQHQVYTPKFQSASLVGSVSPVVSPLLNQHQVFSPLSQHQVISPLSHHQVIAPRFPSASLVGGDSVVSPLLNQHQVISPLSHHQVIAPKVHSASLVGTARQYVGAAVPYLGSTVPYLGSAVPYVGAAGQFVGSTGQFVGSAGSLYAAHHSPLFAVPAQAVVGAKAGIHDESGQFSLGYLSQEGIQVSDRNFLKLGAQNDYIPVNKFINQEGIPISYDNSFNVQQSASSVAPVV